MQMVIYVARGTVMQRKMTWHPTFHTEMSTHIVTP